ncbi:stalk domain-containing protein [Ornithinibacillus scapharcae]|uniref:stalk domain-containing protein n=1 Tax=Ornithinibacillus scapharcae TaxID=1147159 RepID=UPI000225B818|nr:stalk domain-containing protein [Ornithinibacillus scapharcae]
MRKKHVLAMVLVVLIILFTNQSVSMAEGISVYANGERVDYDVQPINVDNRVMVPIRYTSEFLDATVHYDKKKKKVTISEKGNKVEFTIGKKEVIVNGKKKSIDIAPKIYRSRTVVPIRFMVEAFGYDVMWDSEIRSVVINTTGKFIYPQEEIIIPVLMYHHFHETTFSNSTIHPNEFKEQMSYLKKNGYVTITNKDLVLFSQGKKILPKKPILVTMDDGYESNYTYAYPVLKELNMKGTIYVIGSRMRETNETPTQAGITPKLSWEQAKEMYEAGVMDIQNHTYNMHDKAENKYGKEDALIKAPVVINGKLESKTQYEKRVREDLKKNKKLIEEKVGNEVIGLAYPYGIFSDDSEKILKETGHKLSVTTKTGINKRSGGAYLLNRINVPPGTTGKDLVEMFQQY